MGGKLSRQELIDGTTAWSRSVWKERDALDEFWDFNAWLYTWPLTASTPELARNAVAQRPDTRLMHPMNVPLFCIDVSRTYVLAGDPDEALLWLVPFSRSCDSLDLAFHQMPSQVWLGKAYEAKGDKQAACAAYKVLLDRWGKAKPRSVSAEEARARSKALGCAPE